MKLNINNSQLSGTYLPDTYFHLEDLNYSTDIGEYKNLFTLQQYNTILTIDGEIQYGNAFYSYKDTTMKRLEFISKKLFNFINSLDISNLFDTGNSLSTHKLLRDLNTFYFYKLFSFINSF